MGKVVKKRKKGVITQKRICLLLDEDLYGWLQLFNNKNRTINDAIRKAKNKWESKAQDLYEELLLLEEIKNKEGE